MTGFLPPRSLPAIATDHDLPLAAGFLIFVDPLSSVILNIIVFPKGILVIHGYLLALVVDGGVTLESRKT